MVGIVCDNGIRFRPIPTPSFSRAFLHRGTLRDEYKSISDLYVFWRKKNFGKNSENRGTNTTSGGRTCYIISGVRSILKTSLSGGAPAPNVQNELQVIKRWKFLTKSSRISSPSKPHKNYVVTRIIHEGYHYECTTILIPLRVHNHFRCLPNCPKIKYINRCIKQQQTHKNSLSFLQPLQWITAPCIGGISGYPKSIYWQSFVRI